MKKVNDRTKTSLTMGGLSPKTTYYIRIRTVRAVNGKKYYSKWSSITKFKTPSATPYAIDGQLPKSARVISRDTIKKSNPLLILMTRTSRKKCRAS